MNHPNRSKIKDWPVYLKDYRQKRGWSQAALADRLMISKRVVENWEGGVNHPPAYLKIALSKL